MSKIKPQWRSARVPKKAKLRSPQPKRSRKSRNNKIDQQVLATWEKRDRYGQEQAEIEQGKRNIRTKYQSWLSRREAESLWENSSKYPEWEADFIRSVEALRRNGIHSAKAMETYFAKRRFKTLGGYSLEARLIAVLRDKFRAEGKMHAPKQFEAKKSPIEPKHKTKHVSIYKYRPYSSIDK